MDTSLLVRGGVPVQLDRERHIFFTAESTFLLYQKYGPTFWRELMNPGKKEGDPPTLTSIAALQFFLWIGLREDARRNGEALTQERVSDFIKPMTINTLVSALSIALTLQNFAPEPEGKADAVTAGPAAAASGPGPLKLVSTRRSTSTSSSGSRTGSSAGHRNGSGKRRSRK